MDAITVYDISLVIVGVMLLVTAAAILRSLLSRSGGEVGGWELSGGWRRIRAVARITFAEGLRMKIAIIFIALLMISLPVLCLAARGDGTVKGQVQMYLGYSIGLTSFYLALLTIFFSTRTLSAEIASHQIFGLVSKPIPRWQILAGKWLGVTALNVVLLVFAVSVAYAGTRWIVYSFERTLRSELVNRGGLSEGQAIDCIQAIRAIRGAGGIGYESPIIPAMASALGWSDEQVVELLQRLPEPVRVNLRRLDEVRRQVLTARASVTPMIPDLTEAIQERMERLRQQGRLPESPEWTPARIREQIHLQLMREFTTIGPLEARGWVMRGPVPPDDEDFLLSVRYKIQTSLFTTATTLPDGLFLPEQTFLGQWIVGDPNSTRYYLHPLEPVPTNAAREFEVPTQVIEPDGKIRVILHNIDPRGLDVVIPLPDGLEVLYRIGSFERNLLRIGLAVLVPLMFLTAFGILMSTFCTFPVAALICLVLYGLSGTHTFLAESLAMTAEYRSQHPTTREEVRRLMTDALFDTLSLGDLDPTDRVINGRAILWSELGRTAGWIAGLKGGVVMALAVVVFRRRELAAVIV
jgi:hypothetical protein